MRADQYKRTLLSEKGMVDSLQFFSFFFFDEGFFFLSLRQRINPTSTKTFNIKTVVKLHCFYFISFQVNHVGFVSVSAKLIQ